MGSRSPGGLESQRQVKVEAALAAAGRGRGRRGAPRPGWRPRDRVRPGLDPREPPSAGRPSRRRGWAAAHKGGGSARQGVCGTCARWCPGCRAPRARRARLSVSTRKGSPGTRGAGPGCWARSIPPLLSVLPADARPFRGRRSGEAGRRLWDRLPRLSPVVEPTPRLDGGEKLRHRAFQVPLLNGGGEQPCSAVLTSLESCQKSWGSPSSSF